MRRPANRPLAARPLLRIAAAIALVVVGCDGPGEGVEPPNLLLVSIDTLRADHLGCYGYARGTSPNLDRLAAQSLRYENAYAPAPWTLPSHAGMLTGRHPYGLGIVDYESGIPSTAETLAEALRAAGYATAAFVDSARGGMLGADRGFDRGFDHFAHAPHGREGEPRRRGGALRYDAAATIDAGLAWLDAREGERPFFLLLHTKSVHTTPSSDLRGRTDVPYHEHEPWGSRFLPDGAPRFAWRHPELGRGVRYLENVNERVGAGVDARAELPPEKLAELVALYDGGIAYVDDQIGRLLAALEERGEGDGTVLVVTSDHGEAFLEHRFLLHKELYDDLLRVPLLVHDPRRPVAASIAQRVSLLDVTPTLLALAGRPAPDGLGGRVLPTRDDPAVAERPLFGYFEYEPGYYYRAASLREGRFKLVLHQLAAWDGMRSELYDTAEDPGELRPLAAGGEREARMRARLEAWQRSDRGERVGIEIDADSRDQLRALGYVD